MRLHSQEWVSFILRWVCFFEKNCEKQAFLYLELRRGWEGTITVMDGTVETLQNYGAFVKLENGLSGLVHVSQISQKRIKMPSDVLTVGDEVEVKVIGIKDGKISLSMKALEEDKEKAEEKAEKVVIPKAEDIGTNLGDLFKNIQL